MSLTWDNDAANRLARDRLNERLSGARRPEHGQQACAILTGREIAFEDPCCQKLTDLTAAAFPR